MLAWEVLRGRLELISEYHGSKNSKYNLLQHQRCDLSMHTLAVRCCFASIVGMVGLQGYVPQAKHSQELRNRIRDNQT
jgi:hypothetical protein